MPSQYKEKLFLDYDMLKGNIKDFVNATLAFRNDEPATAAVSASLEDGHNDTSHVLSLLALEEENTEDLMCHENSKPQPRGLLSRSCGGSHNS
ncbi:unnamed protein product [Sphagnum jensenii]|uniref:Uncharacterized protein n=1 Tax=Sphagnum jensenii TaxID=128206 RepID=A0ABP1BEN9_9BRYO